MNILGKGAIGRSDDCVSANANQSSKIIRNAGKRNSREEKSASYKKQIVLKRCKAIDKNFPLSFPQGKTYEEEIPLYYIHIPYFGSLITCQSNAFRMRCNFLNVGNNRTEEELGSS